MTEPQDKSPSIPTSPEPKKKFQTVKYVHEKGPEFRTYHVDGTWGAVNSESQIHLTFFTEYPRLATGVIHQVNPENGFYTGEFQLQGVPDPDYFVVVRDFQCSIALSIASAERLHSLLGSFIEIAKKELADQKARAEQRK
jgi:hypothetical protein